MLKMRGWINNTLKSPFWGGTPPWHLKESFQHEPLLFSYCTAVAFLSFSYETFMTHYCIFMCHITMTLTPNFKASAMLQQASFACITLVWMNVRNRVQWICARQCRVVQCKSTELSAQSASPEVNKRNIKWSSVRFIACTKQRPLYGMKIQVDVLLQP